MEHHGKQTRKLLSLDGGGVRGMSTIAILRELMEKLAWKRKVDVIHPWQEFDMIGGTSTGGLLAIMLGRLRMSIDQCEEAYVKFSQEIFTPRRTSSLGQKLDFINAKGKFSTEALEANIKRLIDEMGLPQSEKFRDMRDDACFTFVSAAQQEDSENTVIRSYINPLAPDQIIKYCKIWEAARATSAASTFFDPIEIGPHKEVYVDGGLGYNNPIRLLERESRDLWPDDERIFLSIGTGQAPGGSLEGGLSTLVHRLKDMVTETEKSAEGFQKDNPGLAYYRFNVGQGLADVGLEEYKAEKKIFQVTATYLRTVEAMAKTQQLISVLSTPEPDVYNGNNAASTVAHTAYARPSPSPGAHGHPAALPNAYGSTNYQLPAPQPTNNPTSYSSYNSYTNTMPSQHANSSYANSSYALSVRPPNPSRNSYNSYSPAIASSPTPPPPQNGRPATVPGLSFKDQLQARKNRAALNEDLRLAVLKNKPADVASLLQKGADAKFVCNSRMGAFPYIAPINGEALTLLYIAAHQNHLEILRTLLAHGADPNATSDDIFKTPLHGAIQTNNEEAVEELLMAGADANEANIARGSPLMHAASRENVAIIEMLILAGADVNAKYESNGWGNTALEVAGAHFKRTSMRVLIENGADVQAVENWECKILLKEGGYIS